MTQQFAQTLVEIVDALDEYNRRHPHLAPFEVLQDGEDADSVLGHAAAELWNELLRQHPDDPLALHHLAIIHHGTGYRWQRESRERQLAAVEHWRRALELWSRLIAGEAFWTRLRTVWEDRYRESEADMLAGKLLQVDLAAIRRELPSYLLAVHAAIVVNSYEQHPDVARAHLQLVRESRFPPEVVARTLAGIYHRLVSNLDALCVEGEFDRARSMVEGYLRIDPQHVRGLCDLLTVCAKQAEREHADSSRFSSCAAMLQHAASYAERLSATGQAQSDLLVADALRSFYLQYSLLYKIEGDRIWRDAESSSGAAQAAARRRAAELLDRALAEATRAVKYERAGQDAAQLFQGACGEAILFNLASDQLDAADRAADAGLRVTPHSSLFHALRAGIQLKRGQRDAARRTLDEAERLNRLHPNGDATGLIANLREQLNTSHHLQDAMTAISAQRPADALRSLRLAEAEMGQSALTQTLIAACLISSDLPAAVRTFKNAKQLNRRDPDPNATALLGQLEDVLGRLEHMF